jgi:hypothetical protein
MKFKALRTKREPKEFVHINTIATTMILYTGDLPKPQPLTATLEGMKDYYKNDIPLPDQMTLDDLEMIEFEMFEADTVGADIRNKLTSCKNLVSLLKIYFKEEDEEMKEKIKEFIQKEMKNSENNINYIANLL